MLSLIQQVKFQITKNKSQTEENRFKPESNISRFKFVFLKFGICHKDNKNG